MKTKIKTVHEEQFDNKNIVVGILLNYSEEDNNWKDSFTYYYHDNIYIFFNTIIELINYLLYGEKNMKRAYMPEEIFDQYFDAEYIDGIFKNKLNWV
jgi:hypothetical protein